MQIERVEHPQWTSNAYLVWDGKSGFVVDSNGEEDPLAEIVEREGIELTHVLVTHTDGDHVVNPERWGVPVVTSYSGALQAGGMNVEPIATPGHKPQHWALLVEGTDCFTGDCLFKGTIGGTGNGGPTGYEDQRHSIMDVLMQLPHSVRIHPGHTLPSTIGDEWKRNPFIRIWRGLDPEGDEQCLVRGEPATLILFGPDYDGTHKAWVRYPDGRDAIVGGSQIERA